MTMYHLTNCTPEEREDFKEEIEEALRPLMPIDARFVLTIVDENQNCMTLSNVPHAEKWRLLRATIRYFQAKEAEEN